MLIGNGKAWFDGVSLKVGDEVSATENLLVNSGFEDKEPQKIVPLGWYQAHRPGWPGLKFYRDSINKRTGEASAAIFNGNYENQDGNNWAQVILNPPVGKVIRLSGYIRQQSDDPDFKVSLGIQCLSDTMSASIAEQSVSAKKSSKPGWTHLETNIEVPEGTTAVVVRGVVKGAGVAWFDDLYLGAAK
jgi:hypothetical protein